MKEFLESELSESKLFYPNPDDPTELLNKLIWDIIETDIENTVEYQYDLRIDIEFLFYTNLSFLIMQ